MDFRDYYEIMGVSRDAKPDEIKRAYRKLARKYHPDVSKKSDAEDRFKEVGEAYKVLKDPEKRAAYDQLGENWKAGQEFHPPPDWRSGFEFSDEQAGESSDFFDSLFGHGFGSGRGNGGQTGFQTHGEDHHAKVSINLEDAFHGATRSIVLRMPQLGSSGQLVSKEKTLKIKIPKGVKQGQRIRLSGQGGPSIGGGKAGDLYLEVVFQPHDLYRVDGRDIYLDLPVAPWEAALGATVKVPTPGGVVDLKIPEKSDSKSKLRLKGRGIPGKPAGDLYVLVHIVLPDANSDSAKAIYRKMEHELSFNPRAALGV